MAFIFFSPVFPRMEGVEGETKTTSTKYPEHLKPMPRWSSQGCTRITYRKPSFSSSPLYSAVVIAAHPWEASLKNPANPSGCFPGVLYSSDLPYKIPMGSWSWNERQLLRGPVVDPLWWMRSFGRGVDQKDSEEFFCLQIHESLGTLNYSTPAQSLKHEYNSNHALGQRLMILDL